MGVWGSRGEVQGLVVPATHLPPQDIGDSVGGGRLGAGVVHVGVPRAVDWRDAVEDRLTDGRGRLQELAVSGRGRQGGGLCTWFRGGEGTGRGEGEPHAPVHVVGAYDVVVVGGRLGLGRRLPAARHYFEHRGGSDEAARQGEGRQGEGRQGEGRQPGRARGGSQAG